MTLASPEGRAELVAVALSAAREAATLVHAAWRRHPAAEHKGHTELVTRFDRESERLLRDRLSRESLFLIIGEEGGAGERESVVTESEATWFVDPIDGTTN